MKNSLTGFVLSGLLHAGLIGWAAHALQTPVKPAPAQNLVLTVNLFKTPKKLAPEPVKTQRIKPEKPPRKALTETIKPKAILQAVTKPKPESKPKLETKNEPKSESKPNPKPTKKQLSKNKKKTPPKKITRPKKAKKLVKTRKKPPVKPVAKKPLKKPLKKTVKKQRPTPRPMSKARPAVKRAIATRKTIARAQHPFQRQPQPAPVKRSPPGQNASAQQHRKAQAIRHVSRGQYAPTHRAPYHKPNSVAPQKRVNPAIAGKLSRQYKARLRQLIASHKRYPKRAKRRGQEGKVSLSFSIRHSGVISNIRVIKSSGVSSLDNAAIRAIQQTSRQLPYPAGMAKRSFQLTITLAYQLR